MIAIHIKRDLNNNTNNATVFQFFSLTKTYPNRADSSAVAAVGILFLSLEQNGGE